MDNSDPFIQVIDLWIRRKNEARKSGDWLWYKQLMKNCKRDISELYAQGHKQKREGDYLQALQLMIQTASHELKTIELREKETNLPF